MEISVSFMVERLQKLPNKAFIVEDGSKVFAAVGDELVIFKGPPGKFNQMTNNQLKTFIRRNANRQGTPDEETSLYQDGDWFVDETGEEHRTWELQYNIDGNYAEWVALIHPAANPPKGRRVEMPERSEWDPEYKEESDGEESSDSDS